jgi:hypothetical protein
MVVIKAFGPVSGPDMIKGEYLKSYDPEAYDGRGDALFTGDIGEAMKFTSHGEALTFAMTVPKSRPLRADGKPNKPLTAFTLEIMPIGES